MTASVLNAGIGVFSKVLEERVEKGFAAFRKCYMTNKEAPVTLQSHVLVGLFYTLLKSSLHR